PRAPLREAGDGCATRGPARIPREPRAARPEHLRVERSSPHRSRPGRSTLAWLPVLSRTTFQVGPLDQRMPTPGETRPLPALRCHMASRSAATPDRRHVWRMYRSAEVTPAYDSR